MNRILIIFIFLFVLVKDGHAQTFYKTYGSPAVDEGAGCVIPSSDGNFFVGGYKGDSALIMKVDPLGNVLWTRAFKPSPNYDNLIYHLAITPDNYLIGTGNAWGGSPSMHRDGFYFKIDMNGNMQWMKRIVDNTRAIYLQRIMPVSLTQYVLIGDICPQNGTWYDPFSAQIDAVNGAVQWQSPKIDYIPSSNYMDDIYSATLSPANEVYAVHRFYTNGTSSGSMRVGITKFDSTGNYLWSKYIIQNSSASARMYGIDIIYDNNSLVTCYFGDNSGSSTNYSVGLAKTDTSGVTQWSKDYDITNSSMELSQNVVRVGNSYVITGYLTASGMRDFFAIGTDLNGNVLWSKSYGAPGSDEMNRFNPYSNACESGGLVYFAGETNAGGSRDIVLACIDQNGNIACYTPSTIPVTQSSNPIVTTVCNPTFITDNANIITGTITTTAGNFSGSCAPQSLSIGPDTTLCGSPSYMLNATTSGATQYLWQDGSTASTYTVTAPGTYWVIVYLNCCLFSDTVQISGAVGTPNAQFVIPSSAPCGSIVNFTNNSTGATTYYWDFGDNTNSTLANPTHTYLGTGIFQVVLIASSPCGSDTIVSSITIGAATIMSQFTSSGNSCGLPVNFTNTSINATSFYWDFGDMTSSTTANPTHTYSSTGTYQVMLIASSPCGADTSFALITILPNGVTAGFSSVPSVCVGNPIFFSNTSSGATSYSWSFGDSGTSSSTSPAHIYSSAGTYTVTLIAFGSCSSDTISNVITINPVPVASITGVDSICAGQSTTLTASGGGTYQWSGGSTATTAAITVSPAITTTYYVQVSNGSCISAPDTLTVVITPSPTVTISGPTMICPGTGVTLTAVGNATSYVWAGAATGNGTTITDNPASPSTYYLIGSNNQGCSDTDVVTVGLYDVLNAAILGDDSICVGETTSLSSAGTGTFIWAPSTGLNTTTGSSVLATPTVSITYTLTFTDANGCVTTDAVLIVVDPCTGIAESTLQESTILVQPNPANQSAWVFYDRSGPATITVVNALGQIVISLSANSPAHNGTEIDLGLLCDGFYTINVMGTDFFGTSPLIISR